MHPSLEPSLPVLVVPGMKAHPDGEPAADAGEDTAPEAAAARARRTTLFCVFLIYWYKICGTK